MIIYTALIKYGFDQFKLEILEYCSREHLLEREQYYLDTIKPEYNLLKIAGSSLGFRHNKATLDFFKNERRINQEGKNNLSKAASNRILSELEKKKLSQIRLGVKLSEVTRKKITETVTSKIGVPVIVKDLETGSEKPFNSLTQAAEYLNVTRTAISKCLLKKSILKNRYEINKAK